MRATLLIVVLLAACSSEPADQTTNSAASPAPGQPDRRIECRSGEAGPFARTCSVESFDSAEGRLLTVRKPDGGFRRLRIAGPNILAADGAEQVSTADLADGRIEVSIGGDRFRLPRAVLGQ